jgi:hypothetical protein
MTTQEAKEILAGYRPGTEDELDPMFTEALALAGRDAQLKAWLDESVAFDQTMKNELAHVPAPEMVRAAILRESRIVKVPWWTRNRVRVEWAAAAALVFLAAISAFWIGNRSASFAEFQEELADRSWDVSAHLHGDSSLTLDEVRHALQQQGLTSEFSLPPKLSESHLRGYSVVQWRGHQVPVLCFDSEGQHLSLFITQRRIFSDTPEDRPEFHQGMSWPTVSWTKNDFVFVLTGLKTFDFVKKFRKDRRWDWES